MKANQMIVMIDINIKPRKSGANLPKFDLNI
jgi:hypothetical protein